MKMFLQIVFLTSVVLLSGTLAHAQILPDPLSLVSAPSSPSAGEKYTVTASTPTFDKNTALFDWVVDGRARPDLSGLGKNSVTLSAGPVGSAVRLGVRVLRPGQTLNSSLVVRPANLSLVWFAKTYTPRWYKGKALPIQNSVVNIVAVPEVVLDGVRIRPENLIYRWSLGDQKNIVSGVGENVFSIQTSEFPRSQHHIRIVVETLDKDLRKETGIFITPGNPLVSLYASSPLGKIEPRRTISALATAERGLLDFETEPFFFSASSKKDLVYRWRVGGAGTQGTAENPSILTLNTERQPRGTISISVTVDDFEALIPAVIKTLNLILQ